MYKHIKSLMMISPSLLPSCMSSISTNTLYSRLGFTGEKGEGPSNNWYIPKLELIQNIPSSIPRVGATIQWSANLTEHPYIQQIKGPAHGSSGITTAGTYALTMSHVFYGSGHFQPCLWPLNTLYIYWCCCRAVPDSWLTICASLADFISHEQVYGTHTIHPISGSCRASSSTSLPFKHIQIWYKLCLQTTKFHTDSILLPQMLLASPLQDDWQYGQYDTVIVNIDCSCVWPKSSLEGPLFICGYYCLTPIDGNRALY